MFEYYNFSNIKMLFSLFFTIFYYISHSIIYFNFFYNLIRIYWFVIFLHDNFSYTFAKIVDKLVKTVKLAKNWKIKH